MIEVEHISFVLSEAQLKAIEKAIVLYSPPDIDESSPARIFIWKAELWLNRDPMTWKE